MFYLFCSSSPLWLFLSSLLFLQNCLVTVAAPQDSPPTSPAPLVGSFLCTVFYDSPAPDGDRGSWVRCAVTIARALLKCLENHVVALLSY